MPLFVFLHIPKTAGTSLRVLFWRMFRSYYRSYNPDMRAELRSIRRSGTERPDFFDQTMLLAGHITRTSSVVTSISGRRVVFISVLRDPVSRVVSYYDYARRRPDHFLHDDVRGRTLLRAFQADGRFRNFCENAQTRTLFGDEEPADVLRRDNFLIACPDHLLALANAVSGLSGMPRVSEVPRVNITGTMNGEGIVLAKDQPDFANAVQVIATTNASETALYERVRKQMLVNLPGWLPHLSQTDPG